MFANYLKVAIRSMTRNKGYSAINMCGLAIGMACSILMAGVIALFISLISASSQAIKAARSNPIDSLKHE